MEPYSVPMVVRRTAAQRADGMLFSLAEFATTTRGARWRGDHVSRGNAFAGPTGDLGILPGYVSPDEVLLDMKKTIAAARALDAAITEDFCPGESVLEAALRGDKDAVLRALTKQCDHRAFLTSWWTLMGSIADWYHEHSGWLDRYLGPNALWNGSQYYKGMLIRYEKIYRDLGGTTIVAIPPPEELQKGLVAAVGKGIYSLGGGVVDAAWGVAKIGLIVGGSVLAWQFAKILLEERRAAPRAVAAR